MKAIFVLLILFSCSYDDLCPRQRMLNEVNAKIKLEMEQMKSMDAGKFEQAQEDLMFLLMEKSDIEDIKCK